MQPKDTYTMKLLTSVAGTAAVCFLSSFPSCWESYLVRFAALLRQAFRWFRTNCFTGIPPATVLIIVTGAALTWASEQNRWTIFHPYKRCLYLEGKTLLHVTLPLLTFHPTFTTEIASFKKSLNQVLLLAVTGYAIMVVMTAGVINLIIFKNWNIYTAVIFGIVVCATDPLAVDDAVKVSGVSTTLASLLQGESIIGNTVGMVCFRLFILLLAQNESEVSQASASDRQFITELITTFGVEMAFAPVFGVLAGILTVIWLGRIFNDATLEITIVLSVVHLSYYISELVRMPGIVTVLFFGLYLSSCRSSISQTVESTMRKLIRVLIDISNSVVFFYAGVFLVRNGVENFTLHEVSVGLLLWVVINVLRASMVFFMSPVLQSLGLGMSWEQTLTVWIAGLNGSFNIIMGMMASEDLAAVNNRDFGDLFFHRAMMLLFMKQLLNTTVTRVLLRAIGLRSMPRFHKVSLANAMRLLKLTRVQAIGALKGDRFMADAAFDIVETDTQLTEVFQHFIQKRLKAKSAFSLISSSLGASRDFTKSKDTEEEEMGRKHRDENILMLIKAQKKTYWRHFDRGLMSKEALHQLLEWADKAADQKGRFLDVKNVKQASQVRPLLKGLKRQAKVKLRQLQRQSEQAHGWLYWQQLVLPKVLGYGFHLVDTFLVILAIIIEFVKFCKKSSCEVDEKVKLAMFSWNVGVVGIYGIIALGELLVMKLRFFKTLWHDITLMIVLTGLVDLLVMMSLEHSLSDKKESVGRKYIRIIFILSRFLRLLGLVESVPGLLRRLLTMLEKRISSNLVVGFDICCAYVTGQVEVARQLDAFVHDEVMAVNLKRECSKSKLEIIKTLGILAWENPTIALSVKTRQAMRIVLNAQHDTVEQLKEEGALQDTDAALLTKDLEERMKKLLNSPPLVDDDSVDSMIKNIGWVQGDDQLYQYIKDNMEVWILKPNAVVTEKGRQDFNIYIIGSGVTRMERTSPEIGMYIEDYNTTGNVLGEINFLTKASRHRTVRCETPVKLLALKEDMMETALEMKWSVHLPPLIYRIWLCVAKRVAIKVLLNNPDFQSVSSERLRMLMVNAYLVDGSLGITISVHTNRTDEVILIQGQAIDSSNRQPFKGPCVIPQTCFHLDLQHDEGMYSLVMIIPDEPPDVDDLCIDPKRHGINIDGSVLNLSTFTYESTGPTGLDNLSQKSRRANRRRRSERDGYSVSECSSLAGSLQSSRSLESFRPIDSAMDDQPDIVIQPSRKQQEAAAKADENTVPVDTEGVPQNTEGVPQDTQGVPQDTQGVPQDAQGVPQDTQGVPQDTQGVPQDTQGVPQDTQRVPQDTQGVPHDTQGVPQDTQRVPQDTQGVPQDTQGVPQDTHGVPQDTAGGAGARENIKDVAAPKTPTDVARKKGAK